MCTVPVRMLELLDSLPLDRLVPEKIKGKRQDDPEGLGHFLHVGSQVEV